MYCAGETVLVIVGISYIISTTHIPKRVHTLVDTCDIADTIVGIGYILQRNILTRICLTVVWTEMYIVIEDIGLQTITILNIGNIAIQVITDISDIWHRSITCHRTEQAVSVVIIYHFAVRIYDLLHTTETVIPVLGDEVVCHVFRRNSDNLVRLRHIAHGIIHHSLYTCHVSHQCKPPHRIIRIMDVILGVMRVMDIHRTGVVILVYSLFATVELHLCSRCNHVSRRVIRPTGSTCIWVHTLCPAPETIIRMRSNHPVRGSGLQ